MSSKEFKAAVQGTPEIASCFQPGLKALGSHSQKIKVGDNSHVNGSVELDECVRTKYPSANRWDYIFCYRSKVYFVEVHTASTGEVSTVLLKLQWLKDWLAQQAPLINKLKAEKPYYWVQTNGMHILKHAPQYKQLASKGLLPVARVVV